MKKIRFDWLKIVSLSVIAVVFILSVIPINFYAQVVEQVEGEPVTVNVFYSFCVIASNLFTGPLPNSVLYSSMYILFYLSLVATAFFLLIDQRLIFKILSLVSAASINLIASPYPRGNLLYPLIAGVALLTMLLLNIFVDRFMERRRLLKEHLEKEQSEE